MDGLTLCGRLATAPSGNVPGGFRCQDSGVGRRPTHHVVSQQVTDASMFFYYLGSGMLAKTLLLNNGQRIHLLADAPDSRRHC